MSDSGNVNKQHDCSFLVMHLTSEPGKSLAEKDWFIHPSIVSFFSSICSTALVSLAVLNTSKTSEVVISCARNIF